MIEYFEACGQNVYVEILICIETTRELHEFLKKYVL